MLRILFYSIIRALMTKYMVNHVCAKTVPDSTIIKKSKIKISQGSMPPAPPSLPHALHTDMYLPPPPPIIHTISFCPPLGQKTERNPDNHVETTPMKEEHSYLVSRAHKNGRLRACNYIKIETGQNFPASTVTCTAQGE